MFGAGAVKGAGFIGAKLLAGALTSIGTSMLIDGVTSMLTPQQITLHQQDKIV